MNRIPSILLSFAYLKERNIPLQGGGFDEWVLDSGAYTAHSQGKKVRHEDFLRFALRAQNADDRLKEVFALDVIGNPEKSLENAVEAKKQGLRVIPTWHAGEPLEFAQEMAKQFDKVAIGGLVARVENKRNAMTLAAKMHHIAKCFKAIWPKRIHGLGITNELILREFPFASVDSTSWILKPQGFGYWKCFGKLPLSLTKNIRLAVKCELDWWLDIEGFHNAQWRRELSKVNCDRFRMRFACNTQDIKDISAMFAPGEAVPAVDEQTPELISDTPRPKTKTTTEPAISGKLDERWMDYWKERLA